MYDNNNYLGTMCVYSMIHIVQDIVNRVLWSISHRSSNNKLILNTAKFQISIIIEYESVNDHLKQRILAESTDSTVSLCDLPRPLSSFM